MLDAHPLVAVASDPALPLFVAMRDAALREAGLGGDGLSIEDYYGTGERITRLDAIQGSDPWGLRPEDGERERLSARIVDRAAHEAGHLADRLGRLKGATYGEMLDETFEAVAQGVEEDVPCAAIKEMWVLEFARPLALGGSNPRCVVLRRDPRAIVASMLAMARRDPSQGGHVLSYLRHWRKEAAFIAHYRHDSRMLDRVVVLQYERLVEDAAAVARELCEALGVPFDEAMTDGSRMSDPSGRPWLHNSSYSDVGAGIASDRAKRWIDELDERVVALVELVCGPEMALEGYAPSGAEAAEDELLALLEEDSRRTVSWRSDLGDPARDLALEFERRDAVERGSYPEGRERPLFLFSAARESVMAARSA